MEDFFHWSLYRKMAIIKSFFGTDTYLSGTQVIYYWKTKDVC